MHHNSLCQLPKSLPTYISIVRPIPALFFRIFLVVESQHIADPGDIAGDHAGVMPLRWQAKNLPSVWASRALQC